MTDGLPEVGEHVISKRPGFMHHGIYVGGERVIHYGGNCSPGVRAKVEEITLARFAGDNGYTVVPYRKRRFDGEESVRRARTRLGEDHYCVVSNNCQHFVEWCILGVHKSGQVSHPTGVATGAVVATGVGLAALGAVVNAAFVVTAPTLVVAGFLTRTMYRQNPGQPKSERVARRIGAATTAGVGVIGAVSAMSAPGFGAAFLAFSPALAAAAAGYGAYRLSRRLLISVDPRPLDALPAPAV